MTVAFPFAPVGPDPVGGAEQIVKLLDASIVRAGHASIVIAAEGSSVAGTLIAIPTATTLIDQGTRERARVAYREAIARVLREHAIDVIHFHGVDFADYLPETDVPVIATLHLPPAWYPEAAYTAPIDRVCVSQAQRRACPGEARVICNGVEIERYRPAPHKADHVVALGRLCPEKGFDVALRAAHQARVPMVLAGAVFPYDAHQRHVREAIMPLLDEHRRWIGPVAGAAKRTLLAEARCLVIASRVDETSSLVAMEALASGTPVAGVARGALAEIVDHGTTGWLVDDERDLPEAIARASALSPLDCREAARRTCSAERMTGAYLELYAAKARRPRASSPVDATLVTRDADLAALADEWDALCERCPWATPFQRPAWLVAWRRHLGEGGVPRTIALRRGGRLVGLVPLELRDGVVRWIGSGISDYLDALLEPDLDPVVLREPLARAGDRCVLDCVRPGSPLLALGLEARPVTPSPVLALPTSHAPARLAYERRRVHREREVRWQYDDTGVLLASLFALHRARWAMRGQAGVLASPALERFHADAARGLDQHGLLRMIGLRLDGRLVAVLYGFCDHGRYLNYLSGFAPEVARFSPGRLLVAQAIERASDEGAIELDFLRGTEPYKYEWHAIDRPAYLLEDRCSASAGP